MLGDATEPRKSERVDLSKPICAYCGKEISPRNTAGVCKSCRENARELLKAEEDWAWRTCLMCEKRFWSWGKQNRICDKCKETRAWKEGVR